MSVQAVGMFLGELVRPVVEVVAGTLPTPSGGEMELASLPVTPTG